MRLFKILYILFLVVVLLPFSASSKRCSGGSNCTACSSCNYCGHCAKRGGTCSICNPDEYSFGKHPIKNSISRFWWIIPIGFILYLAYTTLKKGSKTKDK